MIYKGTFWTLNNEDNKLNGILQIEKDNDFSLELFGIFNNNEELKSYEIILGVIDGSKKVTLYNCNTISESKSEYCFTKMIISTIVFNEHFDKGIFLNHIDFKFTGIEIWNSNFDFENDEYNEIIKFKNTCSGLDYTIYNFIQKTIGRKSFNKQADSYIRIGSEKNENIDYWISLLLKMQRFFSIIIGLSINIEKIITHGNKKVIEIYNRNFNQNYQGKEIDFLDCSYVKFQDFVSNGKSYIENWDNLYDILNPTFNLYYLVEFSENKTFLENEFLILMQAIENFHKRKYSSNILTCNRINTFIINPKYPYLTRGKKDEIYLWERIEYLINTCWENDMCKVFNSKIELEKYLIDRATYYRNYLNHWDKEKENKINKKFGNEDKYLDDLVLTERVLREFLKIIILKELGVELNKYVDKIHNVFKYI